jgi:hypothetical protein
MLTTLERRPQNSLPADCCIEFGSVERGQRKCRRVSVGGRLKGIEEIRCALRVAGRSEDRTVIVLQNFEPVANVSGVVLTRFKGKVKIGTEEGRSEFGHEFFDRVAFGAETLAAEIAREARFRRCPVDCLMSEGTVECFGVAERLELA